MKEKNGWEWIPKGWDPEMIQKSIAIRDGLPSLDQLINADCIGKWTYRRVTIQNPSLFLEKEGEHNFVAEDLFHAARERWSKVCRNGLPDNKEVYLIRVGEVGEKEYVIQFKDGRVTISIPLFLANDEGKVDRDMIPFIRPN